MFKSPLQKLVKFFRKSRDGWKAKCQEAKTLNKRLATQVRAVEKSRAAWRQKAEAAERELRDRKKASEAPKKTPATPLDLAPTSWSVSDPHVFGHAYGGEAIRHFLRLVLEAACSFRGASAVMGLSRDFGPQHSRRPAANTGQMWLLQMGLYELQRPKESADDWVYESGRVGRLGPPHAALPGESPAPGGPSRGSGRAGREAGLAHGVPFRAGGVGGDDDSHFHDPHLCSRKRIPSRRGGGVGTVPSACGVGYGTTRG